MADQIRKVAYFHFEVPDKPGEGARLFAKLRDAGVNLLSFTAFPKSGGRAQIDVVPESTDAFLKAAKGAGLLPSPAKDAFFVQGKDRVGAVAEILARLAEAKVNCTASNATCAPGGGFGMILWVKPEDVAATAKALGA